MKQLLILASLLFLSSSLSAQDKKIPKLVIEKGQTYVVGPENTLFVDTLILEDKATIQFAPDRQGVLETKVVFVGKDCLITSRGANGKAGKNANPGTDGENGGNLSLVLPFVDLGGLTIDTRGGRGGNGVYGKKGQNGKEETRDVRVTDANGKTTVSTVTVSVKSCTDGGNATMGGNGGHGGNIILLYSAADFIPVFNHSKSKRNINILYQAGTRGRNGIPGKGGSLCADGKLLHSEVREAKNGELMLVNLEQQSQALLPEAIPIGY
ncbi:hypothetical protein [Pontibacter chinhatensis]|uniref:Collagen triple helix repeat-containing protein n=1 Tax=Pontibacter chinhatensis TaxID=1436961 RepID=A0A1I2R7P5_9BACT|nr:hypothetical protein [Pontibacter chinhatensis]SFG36754.1 hypothetical protein SAMN05421739_102299 [Pontibacter chinhatensis]